MKTDINLFFEHAKSLEETVKSTKDVRLMYSLINDIIKEEKNANFLEDISLELGVVKALCIQKIMEEIENIIFFSKIYKKELQHTKQEIFPLLHALVAIKNANL